jgi:cob(I)alamin adenosyltransferase
MSSTPPVTPPRQARGPRRSIVIVNTGDGKGKSTAAFGTLMRSVARGWKVAVVQFVKSGEWKVGEETIARRLGVDWWTVGDGFTWDSESLDESQAVAQAGWEWARGRIRSGAYDLVVLDEVTYPVNWGWIDGSDVVETLRSRPGNVNVVVTGRDAPAALVDAADTVTEMKNVKHAYDAGIPARRGIDY